MPLTNMQVRDLENVVHPYTPLHKIRQTGPMMLDSGKGIFVRDDQGKEYIEAMSGLWCTGLGWGDEELIEAGIEQLRKLAYYHNFAGKGTEPQVALAEKLKEVAPVPISKVFFTSSGSEANDTQIKLVWYYNNAIGRPKKKKIISRMKAYHGVTIASASLTGLPYNHIDWDLPLDFVKHTTCPHFYRFGEPGETEEDFVARLVRDLEELIAREGPDTVAAFIAEPIMGAGGVLVPPETYFPAIQQVLDRHDILLIDDEVINGFCRTGNWWGAQTMNMKPHTISSAKQLTSAYAPLGAVMIPDFMYEAMEQASAKIGLFGHGFTYGGHPLGAAIGAKTLEIYQKRNILDHVRGVTPTFLKRLHALADHPLVGEARGRGLLGAAELVADKTTRRPFDPKAGVGAQCAKFMEKHGLIVRAIGESIALCPPMIITEDEVGELFDRYERALDETEAWVNKEGLRAAAA
ncbi:aminotransferase [Futiania mangrovi]|uniref:Aminotransferase n=1 Tax=Futiania mangrovi TaxID=2959716 RepID=A0A9J6PN24_9PROT|nr:aminotransferase [Futiania mangrovii]MCP1337466.1 aminotransferase [Futiania mangrovii]